MYAIRSYYELRKRVFADVRDVAGDLFRPKLGVARLNLVLLDVDGGKDVVLDQLFADENRVSYNFV